MTARPLAAITGLAVALTAGPVRRAVSQAAPLGPPAGSPVTVFVDVGVVPMDTDRVLEHQTVLVEGGHIKAVGPVDQVKVPAGATTIDGRGQYLIPGLADMHAHLFLSTAGGPDSVMLERRLFLYLANGATTLRNMDWRLTADLAAGTPAARVALTRERTRLLLQARARAAAGELLSPRFYTAGPWMNVATFEVISYDRDRIDVAYHIAPKDVAKYVAAYKQAGFDFVKPYMEDGPLFDSLAAAAQRLGLPLAGHVMATVPLEHALPRMKSIEHLTGYNRLDLKDPAVVRRLIAATRKAGTYNCVTLAEVRRFVGGYSWVNQGPANAPYEQFVRALAEGGAKLLLGTDDDEVDGALARELRALVQAGLTPYQALVTGTRNPAEYFGTLKETGTIAVGKRADLVLLSGNPLEDVRRVEDMAGVMLGGRWLSRDELERRRDALNVGE